MVAGSRGPGGAPGSQSARLDPATLSISGKQRLNGIQMARKIVR